MNKIIIVRMLDLVNVNEMKKLTTKDNDIMSLRILFLTVSKATTIRNISNVAIISAQEDGQHLLLVFSITLLLW